MIQEVDLHPIVAYADGIFRGCARVSSQLGRSAQSGFGYNFRSLIHLLRRHQCSIANTLTQTTSLTVKTIRIITRTAQ